jgi:two-component system, OmpR family, response regulator
MAAELLHRHPGHEAVGDVTVVHFAGSRVSLDEVTLPGVCAQLDTIAEQSHPSRLLIDFGNVDYVSSKALGVVVTLHKELLAAGRRLTLGNLSPPVYDVFAVTRLDTFLDLWPAKPGSQLAPGVLVVDDSAAVRSVLETGLRRAGFSVWLAAHGLLAVELYRRHQDAIAVVLLDVAMPGLDGPQTLAALRQLCPAVRCCFITADPEPYTEEGLLRRGAERVFRKPFAFTAIIDTLKQLVSRSPRQRQDRWIEIPGKGA